MRPFSVAENLGFRRLIHTLEPKYAIPSRAHFTHTVVPSLYKECKTMLDSVGEHCAGPKIPDPTADEVCPPSLLKPQPATSSLDMRREDEENEYVKYTGKTIRACDLSKSEHPRLLEAEINPRMPAWLESDSEVLEELWKSEVVEVLGFEEEKDSKAIEGNLDEASQKKETDEHLIKLFCVTSPEDNECKRRWKNLRDSYNKERKTMREKKSGGDHMEEDHMEVDGLWSSVLVLWSME
ncbi:zinc finger BED domain-containing 1-like protein [Labeo rohita]|uniref:Zinc finger BED domain-containing 1-like protein n=1 Tax=Labeo rohita TaxID=84645 RepID=A0A498MI59_LABRO|nr:zinc finger BED domain-containing 1-like protein [Labeo rohita]